MITASAIIAFLSKYGSDVLDFLKKHWRITLEVGGAVWIIACCLTHCNPKPSHREQTPQTVDVIAPSIPVPTVREEPIQPRPWNLIPSPIDPLPTDTAKSDSIAYLLDITDWLQNRLYQCDSTYTEDIKTREYADEFETDSARVNYSLVVAGRLQEPPRFSFTPKWSTPTELVRPRGVYLEGSIGPMMSYGKPVQLQAIRGEISIGIFNRKGWSYGIKGGASQLGWDVQASFRRSFSVQIGRNQ